MGKASGDRKFAFRDAPASTADESIEFQLVDLPGNTSVQLLMV